MPNTLELAELSQASVPSNDRIDLSNDFAEYVAECEEHLATARGLLHSLESEPERIEVGQLNELFRNFHTIKGLSGMVSLGEAERLAHHVENYLGLVRKQSTILTADGVDLMFESVRRLEEVIAAGRDHQHASEVDSLISKLTNLLPATLIAEQNAEPSPNLPEPDELTSHNLPDAKAIALDAAIARGARCWWITFTPSADNSAKGITVDSVRSQLQSAGEIIYAEPIILPARGIQFSFLFASELSSLDELKSAELKIEPYSPPNSATKSTAGPRRVESTLATSSLVRVDLGRLDDLIRTVGELVITRSRLQGALGRVTGLLPPREERELEETSQAMERQLRDLREGVMRVRLVPVRDVFARMRLVVRDLARSLNKEIELKFSGEETEVDKFVIERVSDPLLHLVRNAVSHGVETPDERADVGKPRQGRLTLRAAAAGGAITIEVEDDGRGIDSELVFAKARSTGLVASEVPTDASAVLDLICMPGFSTQSIVDRASGRGVGMDVVRRAIEELGGTLTLSTQVHSGTKFTARLPLTLAIADALIVEVAGQNYAIPQTTIREVVQVEQGMTTILENNELLRYRGQVIPLLQLADVFGVARPSGNFPALLIGDGVASIALGANRLLGLREIVVRRLADALIQVPGLAGATELGDGRAVLILDAVGLARFARTRRLTV